MQFTGCDSTATGRLALLSRKLEHRSRIVLEDLLAILGAQPLDVFDHRFYVVHGVRHKLRRSYSGRNSSETHDPRTGGTIGFCVQLRANVICLAAVRTPGDPGNGERTTVSRRQPIFRDRLPRDRIFLADALGGRL